MQYSFMLNKQYMPKAVHFSMILYKMYRYKQRLNNLRPGVIL